MKKISSIIQQISLKKTLTFVVIIAIAVAVGVQVFNQKNVVQESLAFDSTKMLDLNIQNITDGTSTPQGFEVTPNDGSALTDPGDDQSPNNLLVRAGDSALYKISVNLNHKNTSDVLANLSVTNGKFTSLPTNCLTPNTTPSVLAAVGSYISSDGKNLVCNTGMKIEGTSISFEIGVVSDRASNDSTLSLSGFASSAGLTSSPSVSATDVKITARPSLDLIKYIDSTLEGGTVVFTPAYENEICKNGATYTKYFASDPAACTGAGDVKGDIVIYKFKFQHSRLGSEGVVSPFDVTLDDAFTYVSGFTATNNASLVSCSVASGYEASSGSISCGALSAGLTRNYTITLTGVNDSATGSDGIVGNYLTKYFIPETDYTPGSTLNTSNLITARSSAAAGTGEAGWDPQSLTNISNFGSAGTEKTNTCNVDPGPGLADASCNNRVDVGVIFPPPGAYCADTVASGNFTFQGCFGTLKGNTYVSPGQTTSFLRYTNAGENSAFFESVETSCNMVSIDSAGNPLYHFTGNVNSYYPSNIRSSSQITNFHRSPPGPMPFGYVALFTDSSGVWKFVTNVPGTTQATDLVTPIVEFSTTPIAGNIPGTSDRLADCSDAVGNWVTWTGPGSIPTGQIYTRSRVKYRHISTEKYLWETYHYPEITLNSSAILSAFCATNPAGPNCAIPLYSSIKFDDLNGNEIMPWTSSGGGPINNTAGSAANVTFQGIAGGQDLMYVNPAMIKITKSNDKPFAVGGNVINYTLTPKYTGSGTSNITVTDILPTGLTFVPNSWPSICSVSGQVLTCVYSNANANAGLSPSTITYQAKVDLDVTYADFYNVAEISSSDPVVMTDSKCAKKTVDFPQAGNTYSDFCGAISIVQVRSPGGLRVEKKVDKQYFPVDSKFEYRMRYSNLSGVPLGDIEFIDVLPYNGDSGLTTATDRYPASAFSGKVQYIGSTLPAGVTIAGYTTAASGTINLDPKCASNNAGATWIDGTNVLSAANPNGNDWSYYCPKGDAATTWVAGTPTVGAEITGIKYRLTGGLATNLGWQEMKIELIGVDNVQDDIYTNNFSARTPSLELPVISNDVWVKVYEGQVGNKVWMDRNADGVIDPTELPVKNVCVKLEVDASDAAWATARPLVSKTKLSTGLDGLYGTADDATLTVKTDANGNYLFDHLPEAIYKVSVLLDPSVEPSCAGATSYPTTLTPTYDLDDGKTTTPATPNNTLISICNHYDLVKNSSGAVILPPTATLIDTTTGLVTTDTVVGVKTLQSVDRKSNDDPNNNGSVLGGTNFTLRDCNELAATFLEDADFGYRVYNIDGTVWYDVNEDTLNPAVIPACAAVGSPMAQTECGIPAENLKLLDALGNPVLDPSGNAVIAVTNSLGFYQFTDLFPGNYTVVETQPTGFGSSTPNTKAVTIVDQDIHDIDFGETTAMLDGCVYVDADDDGVKDAGELPIGSVAIVLTGSDIRGTVVNIPTTTDAVTGCYSYLGLLEGNYTVTETQPAIYDDGKDTAGSTGGQTTTNDVITQIPLISAGESLQNNFGELYKGRISGCVYADYDVSDVYNNPPDLVIPAVMIELQSSAGVTIKSQTTDALGCYDFKNLPDATYQVKETQPTSYLNGKNFINSPATIDGTDDLISNIVITANHDPKNDFSEYPISGLCGIVYHDRNRSATQMPDANEEGLQNWTLTLTGAQVLVPTTTTTDIQGRYCFPNLAPGSYTVTETQNTLYASSYNNDQVEVVAVPSTPVNNVNFGEYLGTIACKVYYDKDKSSTFAGADTVMTGEEIKLVDQATGLVVGTQFTDASGNCMFRDVPAGTYKLIETQPLGYSSTQNQSNQITVILLPGGDSINNNFGEALASLSGHVYSDEDIDLIFEHAGPDIAIPAVTINLSCTTVKGDIVTKTTTTNALGYFEFKDLLAGKCSVVETQPTAYADEVEFVGSVGGTLGADEITNITLLAGEDGIHYDFLEIYKEDIKGCSYYDENNDGVMDAAETGIAGVTVKLKNAAGVEIGTTTTMADGCYEFLDIPLGTYTVVETPPDGYGSSTPDTIEVILRRDTGLDKDFGDTKSSSIACMVFDDTDNDGVKDEAEVGVANVTVKLTGKDGLNADVNMSVTTDNSGNCIFSGLNAGEYDLVFTQPDGYIMGIKTVGTKGGDIVQTGFENIKVLGLENVTGYNYAVRGGVLKVCTMYDKNKSGVIESDEVGVSGQLVELRKANGDLVTTLTTGADGCVTKYGIVLGDYKVKAVNSKYLIIGEATLGISFTSEKLVENVTYGLQDGGVLNGCIYNDMNKNKSKDTGENGISEVKVTVTMGADTKSTMTDTNGCYTLNTGFGEYTLKVEPKPGYELTSKGEVKGTIDEKMKEVKTDFGMVKGLAVTGNYYMIYMLLGVLLVAGVGVKRKLSMK